MHMCHECREINKVKPIPLLKTKAPNTHSPPFGNSNGEQINFFHSLIFQTRFVMLTSADSEEGFTLCTSHNAISISCFGEE